MIVMLQSWLFVKGEGGTWFLVVPTRKYGESSLSCESKWPESSYST